MFFLWDSDCKENSSFMCVCVCYMLPRLRSFFHSTFSSLLFFLSLLYLSYSFSPYVPPFLPPFFLTFRPVSLLLFVLPSLPYFSLLSFSLLLHLLPLLPSVPSFCSDPRDLSCSSEEEISLLNRFHFVMALSKRPTSGRGRGNDGFISSPASAFVPLSTELTPGTPQSLL